LLYQCKTLFFFIFTILLQTPQKKELEIISLNYHKIHIVPRHIVVLLTYGIWSWKLCHLWEYFRFVPFHYSWIFLLHWICMTCKMVFTKKKILVQTNNSFSVCCFMYYLKLIDWHLMPMNTFRTFLCNVFCSSNSSSKKKANKINTKQRECNSYANMEKKAEH
jgi:hypothetical protein